MTRRGKDFADDLFQTRPRPRSRSAPRPPDDYVGPLPPVPAGPLCPKTGHPLRCACGAWACVGTNVNLREGRVGTWTCWACAPDHVKRGQPRFVDEEGKT